MHNIVMTPSSGTNFEKQDKVSEENSFQGIKPKSNRVDLYDNFRGIAVILYIISMMSNLIKKFTLPFWMVHT